MRKIAIIGAGGFGREVQVLIEQINNSKKTYELIGFFDDEYAKGELINDIPVLGSVAQIDEYPVNLDVVFAVGDPGLKERLVSKIKNPNISFPTLIHPNVQIGSDFVKVGKGCIITSGVCITNNIVIGNFVVLNLSTTIGHDTTIGDYSAFMPAVNISGDVIVKKSVYIGTGATIINKVIIGKEAVIGAGAVIIKEVPERATVVGNPGKVIKIRGNE